MVRSRLASSAQRITLQNKKVTQKQSSKGQEWQTEAWGYFDEIPELKYCTDEATQALTRDGWRSVSDLEVGTEILVVDPTTRLAVWQPIEHLNVFAAVDEAMVSIEGLGHSSLTTHAHRWLLDSGAFTTSAELGLRDALVIGAPSGDQPTDAKHSDALVELVAWFWTEGNIAVNPGQSSRRISISQSHRVNPANVARIRRCLTELFGPASTTLRYGRTRDPVARWREIPQGTDMTIFYLNHMAASRLLEIAPDRIVATRFVTELTAAQLRLFIDTSFDADGHAGLLCQSGPARLEGLFVAAMLAGLSPRIDTNGCLHLRRRLTYNPLNAQRAAGYKGRAGCVVSEEPYTGRVWCPTTAAGTWFARRNGTVYCTGNSVWFMGNVMSKIRLFVGVRDADDPEADPIPVTDPNAGVPSALVARAQAELRRLKGPLGGIPEICREMNMNLEIAAECYLVGLGPTASKDETDDAGEPVIIPEEWDIRSVSEVETKEGKVYIRSSPSDPNPRQLDPDNDTIIRIWQRHPRWSMQSDCNMRGVLNECEALVLLIGQVKAEAKSQMSAGYFTIPSEITDSAEPRPEEDDNADEGGVNPVLQTLYEGATEPIEDPASAAAVAPTFLRGPAEFLKPEYVRHITIGREASAVLEARIQARVERLARGLNLPVETVMGHQQTTFANASQVAADQFADHFYPRDVLIVDALTVAFLQPNLLSDGGFDPDLVERIVVWFEPGDQIKQTDLSVTADKGHALGAISDAAWRRVTGWSDDDAPDATERLLRILERVRSVDPGITTGIVELLGEPLNIPAVVPAGKTTAAGPDPTQAAEAIEQIALERVIVQAILARRAGQNLTMTELFTRAGLLPPALGPGSTEPDAMLASGEPSARTSTRNPGFELMSLDRDLRTRLIVSADRSMTRALEKAGNKLRTKSQKHRELVSGTHPRYVCATLGPKLVAAAGFTDDSLIGADSWDALRSNYLSWGGDAQRRALRIAEKLAPLSVEYRANVVQQQNDDLQESWAWLADQLTGLAHRMMYSPDPADTPGENDPTVTIPAGLIRQAIARAGGARNITAGRTLRAAAKKKPAADDLQPVQRSGDLVLDPSASNYVALDNGAPLGGIGTGATVMSVLDNGQVGVEAYQWEYGPAFRLHPFEEHETLNGEVFDNFDSDVLAAGDWIGDFYFPGDHDGCNCDVTPIIVEAAAVSDSLDTFGGGE